MGPPSSAPVPVVGLRVGRLHAGGRAVSVLGLAHRGVPFGTGWSPARDLRVVGAWTRPLAGLDHGPGPQLERAQGHGLLLVREVAGNGDQVLVHGDVGAGQRLGALRRQAQLHPPAVRVLLATVDQPAGDEAVDEGGDGGPPHRQAVGQARRGGGALGQDPEDPVLGKRQLDLGQRDLHPLGEPGRDPAVGAQHRGRRGRLGAGAGTGFAVRGRVSRGG